MPVIHRSALVPYTVAQMYALVSNIESYPEFLPWVRSVTVHDRSSRTVTASLELSKGPVTKSFTTQNELSESQDSMTLDLVEGPFHHLQGRWGFQALGDDGCKVTLDMDFEFSNRLLAMTVGPMFNEMVNRLVNAFIERAPRIYGQPGGDRVSGPAEIS